MKILIIGMLLTSNCYALTVKIEAKTKDGFSSWFMPTRINGVSTNRIGSTECITVTKGKAFQLVCERSGEKVLIYQDQTPEKDAIIATPNLVIKIETQRKSREPTFSVDK
tara:strand:- start:77 stop:406 length:330 start_codon:yes stop_codon:yes gene_type:complete